MALCNFLAGDSLLCSGFLSLGQAELHGAGAWERGGPKPAAQEILPGHTMPDTLPLLKKRPKTFPGPEAPSPLSDAPMPGP